MTNLRRVGDDKDAAQRFQAQQAHIEGAALRGELGIDSQIVAMSAVYHELLAAGKLEAAATVKAEAMKINESRN